MDKRIIKYSRHTGRGLMLLLVAVMAIPLLNSCGKSGNATPNSNNTRLLIANLSPDVYPVDLYLSTNKQNSTPYRFPTASSYFYLSTIDYPLIIRSDTGKNIIYDSLTVKDALAKNTKYTLLITGLAADNSLTSIFMVDTSTLAPLGSGKLRFANASPRSAGFDVYANGTKIFTSIAFGKHSDFKSLPVGNYDIKIYTQGDNTAILKEINPLTIGDSNLYTLYTYGMVGRTDSAAFATSVITNK